MGAALGLSLAGLKLATDAEKEYSDMLATNYTNAGKNAVMLAETFGA